MDASIPGLNAVVPAGGAGTRLWPLSRSGSPKFLHDLTGSGRTLLQATWDRLRPLTGRNGVLVVTGAVHAGAVADQLPALPARNLLAEPSPKNSMAAIGLAAAVLHGRDPDALLGSFAADHVIAPGPQFAAAVTEAVEAARAGYLATLGIAPTSPSTAFGYIEMGAQLEMTAAASARLAAAFVEKPDAHTAAGWLAGGRHRWNAGMFVARADVLLALLAEQHPALHDGLVRIARAWDSGEREEVLARTWPGLLSIAIDHAIAEPAAAAGRVAMVPADFGWDDVGDWAALHDLLPEADVADGEGAVRVLGDSALVIARDASGVVVPASGRTVAVLGLDDVVVVDTPDALLVTTRERAQEVRAVVEALRLAGRTDLL